MSRAVPPEVSKRLAEWVESGCRAHGRLSLDILQAIATPAANDDAPHPDRELQQVMQRMVASGRWKEARVILVEFALRDQAEAVRLRRLGQLGITLSRAAYYVYLAAGLAFVEGALSHSR